MTMTTTHSDPTHAALLDDARLAGARLAFVEDGTGVVLTGTVCNIWQYQTLRALLKRSPVVIDVGIVAARRSDPEIADAVRDALGPEGGDVRARVRGGLITLNGAADASARAIDPHPRWHPAGCRRHHGQHPLLSNLGTKPGRTAKARRAQRTQRKRRK